MTATIQKWGSSLALRLPDSIAADSRLLEGKVVELVRTDEGLLLKLEQSKRYCLAALAARITPENVHPETNWGPDVGREIIE